MQTVLQHLRYALRVFGKSPAFTAVAVLTMALGIGANTAIFSVVNSVLLGKLPYRDVNRILVLKETRPQTELDEDISYPNFQDWRDQNRTFENMAAFKGDESFNYRGRESAERIPGMLVSGNFFRVLGVSPILGRDFVAAEDQRGAKPTVIISSRFWRSLGGANGLVGKEIRLNDESYTVIGVLPREFWFFNRSDVFVPIQMANPQGLLVRGMHLSAVAIGRVKKGVSYAQAKADIEAIHGHIVAQFPDKNSGSMVKIVPLAAELERSARRSVPLLFVAVGLVLLIACVNVSNLLLARSVARRREIAIRMALGASRRQILGQFLVENVLLCFLGGAAGLLIASWSVPLMAPIIPSDFPQRDSIGLNTSVLAFAFSVSVLTGVLFGFLSAHSAGRTKLEETLREGGRTATSSFRLQNFLAVFELGLALVLLVGAGLTMRSIFRLAAIDPGFDPQHVTTFTFSLSPHAYADSGQVRGFYEGLLQQVRSLPGVHSAAYSAGLPYRVPLEMWFYVAGRARPQPKDNTWNVLYITTSAYLRTMGLRVLKGRFLNEHDGINTSKVLVIDEATAHSIFPHEDPIGQHIIFPFGDDWAKPREIVGVVNHVSQWGLAQDSAARIQNQMYMPAVQMPSNVWLLARSGTRLLIRSERSVPDLLKAVRTEVQAIDKGTPIYEVETMNEVMGDSVKVFHLAALLLGLFAGLAMVLAIVGVYGVMAYTVSQRIREIGVRIVLGADRVSVLKLVVGKGAALAIFGVAGGLIASVALTRFLSSFLYGISPMDAATFAAMSLILAGTTLLACYIPAQRAAKVDPMMTLRHE